LYGEERAQRRFERRVGVVSTSYLLRCNALSEVINHRGPLSLSLLSTTRLFASQLLGDGRADL
jgi:hypothetical protein